MWIRSIIPICLILALPACDDSPQSPQANTSISGTVVFDQTGSPAVGVDVALERCRTGSMMDDDWDRIQHMKTDSHGRFHFEYMHQSMHRYRVGVPGLSDPYMCSGSNEDELVLRIPSS